MTIHFYLKYHTRFGQSLFVSGNQDFLGNNEPSGAVPLTYFNENWWYGFVTIPDDFDEVIHYKYILKDIDNSDIFDGEENRFLNITIRGKKDITVTDTWNSAGDIGNVFFSDAFSSVLLPTLTKIKSERVKGFTHEFRVKAPLLKTGETICLIGSTKSLGSWNTEEPIFLSASNNWFITQLQLGENEWPATYKYGIYDTLNKKLIFLEDGDNRVLPQHKTESSINILHDGFVKYNATKWKGAGVSIPVFSLRSQKSFGTGEFPDIKLLIDWAKLTGLQLIQLLPINDTTAQHTWKDSYPYAAISAFALHPLYINLDKVAGKDFASIVKPLKRKQKQLNSLDQVDYEQVMKFKLSVLRELYEAQKNDFRNDLEFFSFFDLNRDWLVPYAAFCYLRDKNETPDFSQWKAHSEYNESAIQNLASPSRKHYDSIAFYYFVQYHLHLQMKEVTDYAHRQKIVLKGDIPIGIYRFGCDAWINPSLYNMDQQAGAPPDDFAVKGQNWGFPTYNWQKMKEDHFEWWRKRFDQMSNYFDAFRIDHILGFFRIWSIPMDAVEGILGKFSPAIPVDITEFNQNNIWFDHDRYCNPYITDEILHHLFGDRKEEVIHEFLNSDGHGKYRLSDFINTQAKVVSHLKDREDDILQNGLFELISNVILIPENDSELRRFHFRISMQSTSSFLQLEYHTQQQLNELYNDYFYRRQDAFWRKEALEKLPGLKRSTNMLVCGEDLGMVPACVPDVMNQLGILSLEIERMPKDPSTEFFHPSTAPYLSVVTPSTHDMSTIRGWWEENRNITQRFYNFMLGHYGDAPAVCEAWINREIILQHLYSPAMWSIFQLQDLLGSDEQLRHSNPHDERINIPSNPDHYWNYRMHLTLEQLLKEVVFNSELKRSIEESGRAGL